MEGLFWGPRRGFCRGGVLKLGEVKDLLEVLLPEEELARRKESWKPRPPAFRHGAFARYAALVAQADEGAVLETPHPG